MADLSIQPIGERILVAPIEAETVTAGGLILPDSVKEKPQQATVLAVGSGIEDKALVKGAKVMYGKYAGTQVEQDGVEYLILELKDVLATF